MYIRDSFIYIFMCKSIRHHLYYVKSALVEAGNTIDDEVGGSISSFTARRPLLLKKKKLFYYCILVYFVHCYLI